MNHFSLTVGVLLLTTFFACGAGSRSQADAPAGGAERGRQNEQTSARAGEAATPPDGTRRVTVSELGRLIEQGGAVVVDVRGSVEFEMGRIKGARSIPLGLVASRAAELPKDKLIVTYCT